MSVSVQYWPLWCFRENAMNRVTALGALGVGFGFILHRIGCGSVLEVQQSWNRAGTDWSGLHPRLRRAARNPVRRVPASTGAAALDSR